MATGLNATLTTLTSGQPARAEDVMASLDALNAAANPNFTSCQVQSQSVVVTGAGNLANTPIEIIIVGPSSSNLPAAGVKGRIAIIVPFSLP